MQKFVIWMIFIISPLLYGTPAVQVILLMELFFIIAFFISNRNTKQRSDIKKVSALFGAYFLWSFFILLITDINLSGIIRLLQIIGCYCCFCIAVNVCWNLKEIKNVVNVICTIMIVVFLYWALISRSFNEFSFIYVNPDTFGSLLFVWFFSLFLVRPPKRFYLSLCVILLLFTGARAAFLSALIFILLFVFSQKTKTLIKHYKLFFLVVTGVLVTFVIIYPSLLLFDIGLQLDELSHVYFGKNLLSGRNVVWLEMFDKILQSPWFGWGLSADPNIVGITKSSHNTFIQTALQSGFIGVVLLYSILYNVYLLNKRIVDSYYRRFLICLVPIIITHECFEICLTQNAFTMGLIMWFLMGLSCNNNFIMSMKKQG